MYLAAKVECGQIVRASLFNKREDAIERVKDYLKKDNIYLDEKDFEDSGTYNFIWEILPQFYDGPHVMYQVLPVYKD
jgi:hypothetical protein